MFNNFMRIFTTPYMAIVPVDSSTHMKCSFIRKTNSLEEGLIFLNAGNNF
jgi:hypothetical protein